MREIADKVGAILLIDMAHTAGLIAAGLLENPVKYAHIVTSTTHKTLRGPRGGIILMGKDFENPWGLKTPKGVTKMMSQILNSAVFPGIQGGPLEHVIAAKAVAFGEALDPSYKEYQKQVQKNAKAMAEAFTKRGYKIVSEGTDNHLMLVDLRTKFPELTGKLAEKCLVAADITTNKNMVPFDSRSPFQTSGLRFGTPAITTRGLKEDKMEEIVALIDRVLSDPENEANIAAVRKEVNAMMANYPLFAWSVSYTHLDGHKRQSVGQIRRNAERPERFDADDWVIILVFGNERVVLVVRTELRLPVKTGAERDRMFVVEGVESAEGHQVVALFHVAHPGRVGESHLEQVVAEERRGRVLEYGVSSAGSRYRSVGHTRCADIGVDRQELLSRCRRCARQEDYCENEDLFHNL